jgi:hypothetical protein
MYSRMNGTTAIHSNRPINTPIHTHTHISSIDRELSDSDTINKLKREIAELRRMSTVSSRESEERLMEALKPLTRGKERHESYEREIEILNVTIERLKEDNERQRQKEQLMHAH